MNRSVFVTGAAGYLGGLLVAELAANPGELESIVGTDIRIPDEPIDGVTFVEADVRDPGLVDLLTEHAVDVVVHLAAIVSPGKK
ncbi:MAG: NAD-dependent epimerase/dehydratase family protein, partial [Actinomycetota bacterium]